MANIYKQAAQRERVVPGGAKNPKNPTQDEPKEEKVITTPAEEEKPVVSVQEDEVSIADAYDRELKRNKNKKNNNKVHMSLTLSPDVKAELQKRADRAGKTASAYLDGLLKEVVFKL